MSNRVIIIIDPQNDFSSPSGIYAKRHTGITEIQTAKQNINKLFALHNSDKFIPVKSDYRPHQFGQGISMCIPGSFGHQIDEDLQLNPTTLLITKTDHSAFSSANFQAYLRHKQVNRLLLCGFLAEYCVRQTALDAIKLGYGVDLVADCIGTGDDVQHRKRKLLEELKQKGAVFTLLSA